MILKKTTGELVNPFIVLGAKKSHINNQSTKLVIYYDWRLGQEVNVEDGTVDEAIAALEALWSL